MASEEAEPAATKEVKCACSHTMKAKTKVGCSAWITEDDGRGFKKVHGLSRRHSPEKRSKCLGALLNHVESVRAEPPQETPRQWLLNRTVASVTKRWLRYTWALHVEGQKKSAVPKVPSLQDTPMNECCFDGKGNFTDSGQRDGATLPRLVQVQLAVN